MKKCGEKGAGGGQEWICEHVNDYIKSLSRRFLYILILYRNKKRSETTEASSARYKMKTKYWIET
jgi:hypothetical protein